MPNEETIKKAKTLSCVEKKVLELRTNLVRVDWRCVKAGTMARYKSGFATSMREFVFQYEGAQKCRLIKDKVFYWRGDSKNAKVKLFGSNIFQTPGKYLAICEGEIDAMSYYQMFKCPAVSIPGGVGTAIDSIKHNMEYIKMFSKIIIFFDNDEQGIKASNEALKLLKSNSVQCTEFARRGGIKDANEFLIDRIKNGK